MATVAAGGPFSMFEGVDRILTVLEGELTLAVDGAAPVTLGPKTPPLPFPGDVPVAALTPPRPVTDLNMMTRRGDAAASVQRLRLEGAETIAPADWTLVLSRSPGVEVEIDGETHGIGLDDAILIAGGAAASVHGRSGAEVLIASVRSTRSPHV